MMGTFAAMLAKKRIPTSEDNYRADVSGDIENIDGVLKIVRINVRYLLSLSSEKRSEAQEAFAHYLPHCPAAQSVIGCIAITHQLDFQDMITE